jgi:hypothetical protein
MSEKRIPLPAQSQQPARYDCEDKREGTCNLFAFFQPLAGWRHIKVTEQRTARDFAYCMKELVDELFPHAKSIRVVLDNLNPHTPLYQTFPPQQARRILNQIEFHYTPKHGSWFNMVDDSGHRKSGNLTAGVGRQYLGEIGKTDNGIVTLTTHLYMVKRVFP